MRVLAVSAMPFNVKIWVEDCDDGSFNAYIDKELITEAGASSLQKILNATMLGQRRLDESTVQRVLRAVTG
ncbi:hypothetical protein [Streptomyces sp. NPDC005732]|uniref:hypothetical protein n=1 Tax=Streptomyces sp. NPDC005732 TaxID=3157057 RepID=UPI0033DB1C5E